MAYVGGGLPGGENVDDIEGERSESHHSYAVAVCAFGGLQMSEAGCGQLHGVGSDLVMAIDDEPSSCTDGNVSAYRRNVWLALHTS